MQNYPTLSTEIRGLQLQPLQSKHLGFMVNLLSHPEIQRTLFRVKTKVTKEKQSKSIEKMYSDPPKEITYVLTLKSLFAEKYIGYVKIKLIDWDIKSCYISIAIDPAPEYRGKGYAKACYNSFFQYLFSLGFMKIYGRTYENNLATIKLNQTTGFRFIGRQKSFVLYPENYSLDALFFEKLNPVLEQQYPKRDARAIKELTKSCDLIAKALNAHELIPSTVFDTLQHLKEDPSLLPATHSFINELLSNLSPSQILNGPSPNKDTLLLREYRAKNAKSAGLTYLAYPLTQQQRAFELELTEKIKAFDLDGIEKFLKAGALTPENHTVLTPLFCGQ